MSLLSYVLLLKIKIMKNSDRGEYIFFMLVNVQYFRLYDRALFIKKDFGSWFSKMNFKRFIAHKWRDRFQIDPVKSL